MSLGIAGRIEVYLQEIDLFPGIKKEIKTEELEASLLILHMGTRQDAISDDVIDLLRETVP